MKRLLVILLLIGPLVAKADDLRIVAITVIEDATSSATGATWVAFPAVQAANVQVTNISGATVEVRYFSKGKAFPVITNAFKVFRGVTDASQLSFRRVDQSNTPVTVNLMIER